MYQILISNTCKIKQTFRNLFSINSWGSYFTSSFILNIKINFHILNDNVLLLYINIDLSLDIKSIKKCFEVHQECRTICWDTSSDNQIKPRHRLSSVISNHAASRFSLQFKLSLSIVRNISK